METELTLNQLIVFDLLRKGYSNKTTLKELSRLSKLSPREVSYVLAELREFYPICSTKMDGGGIWIADNNSDILKFIKEMEKLRDVHQLTINFMEGHIK